jgi:hypothetical protein
LPTMPKKTAHTYQGQRSFMAVGGENKKNFMGILAIVLDH